MRIAHVGQQPVIDPTAVVAPTAILSGDVQIGAGTVVLAGAIVTAQGAPVRIGQHCIVMEHAVVRGAGKYPCTLGNHVLVGPQAHISGATIHGRAFIATGASIFNGAVLEEGVVVAINAVVHIATRCLAGTGVPMGHIAFGDPATVYAPHEAPAVHAQLAALGFTKAVFGLDAQRLADADTIEQLCARYAKALSAHRDDHILPE
jgi:carbonic anhydrase/acetyltransferase-like protein (isoleucine patch superfamily)